MPAAIGAAADVFVLPAGAQSAGSATGDKRPKSYRQDQTDGPNPLVSVEVPSEHDTFVGLMAKIRRCLRLGVVVYLVSIDDETVLRYRPDRESPESWARRPIDELGGLAIEFNSGTVTVVMPDGTRGSRDHELLVGRERQVVDVAEGPDS